MDLPLYDSVWEAGLQILFSSEGVRTILDTSTPTSNSGHLLQALSSLLQKEPDLEDHILHLIPNILEAFILGLSNERTNLSTVQGLGATEAARIKSATVSFVEQCIQGPLKAPGGSETSERVLQTKAAILLCLERHAEAFDPSEERPRFIVQAELGSALDALNQGTYPALFPTRAFLTNVAHV